MRNKFAAFGIMLVGLQASARDVDQPRFVPPPAIEGIFGSEFTFTYDGTVSDHKRLELIGHMRKHLVVNQPDGAKFTEPMQAVNSQNVKFVSPNGWWIEVTKNPGVVEFKKKPLTIAQTKRFKSDIQDAIFASSAAVGLFPWDYLGGGHLNMDIGIFGNNIRLARNFVVDFWNHNELAMGILSFDTNNAMPFDLFTYEVQKNLRTVIRRADDGAYGNTLLGLQQFFSDLDAIQSVATNVFGMTGRGKHHDLNFNHKGRIEVRCVRPQANMDVWVNQIELIESRINNHLRFFEDPIPLKPRIPLNTILKIEAENPLSNRYVPPIDPQLALRSFHQYVTESGLDWSNHRGYIWPPWARGNLHITNHERGSELEKFEQTEFFIIRDRLAKLRNRSRMITMNSATCATALTP